MQTTLLSLAIALILALLAALLGPHFVDWNAHRATFEQQASQLVGLPVRVAGPMDVRLLPSPTLNLNDIQIGEPGDPQTVRARALGIEFALPPLLSGKLNAVEMRLIGPELQLALGQDGAAIAPAALAGMNVEALSIDKLVVEDARVVLSDGKSGAQAALDKLWFNGEVRALRGPFRGEGAFVLDGGLYAYRISAGRPEPAGTRLKLTLEPSGRPVVAEADGLLNLVDGTPRFEGLASLSRRIPAGKGDRGFAEPWHVRSQVKADAAKALFEQVDIQYGPDERALKLNATAEARFGADPRLDVIVSAHQLDADRLLAVAEGKPATPRDALGYLLAGAMETWQPPLPVQIGFGIDAVTLGGAVLQNVRGDLEISRDGASIAGLEIRAPGHTHVQASGRLGDAGEAGFAGPVNISAGDPRVFMSWFDGHTNVLPAPSKPLKLRGDLTWSPGRFALEGLNASLDRNAFGGSLSYVAAYEAQGARVTANLKAEDIDLDALIDIAGASAREIERPEEVTLGLQLGRLRYAGIDAHRVNVALTLNGEALAIETLSIDDFGGANVSASGRIDLKADRPAGQLSFDAAFPDGKTLAALGTRFLPEWSETLQRVAAAASPATFNGQTRPEPSAGPHGRVALNATGQMGPARLKLTSVFDGGVANAGRSGMTLQAVFDADDMNALLKMAAADTYLSVPAEPGRATLTLKGRADTDMRVESHIEATGLDMRVGGSVREFTGGLRSASLDVIVSKAALKLPAAGMAGVPVSGTASVSIDPDGLRIEKLQARVSDSGVNGRADVQFGVPANVSGDLTLDTLDLPASLAAAGIPLRADDGKTWSASPFPALPLPVLAGSLNVNAARAGIAADMQASKLRASVVFRKTDIAIQSLDAELHRGKLSGDLVLRKAGDGIAVSGHVLVSDADATPFLAGEKPGVLNGRATLDLAFDGAGLSPRALIGSLNGKGTLVFERGWISALDPKAFGAVTRSIDQGLPLDQGRIQEAALRVLDAGPLVVHRAEANLSLAAGVLRIESFTSSADRADLRASGSYNLSDSNVDLRFVLQGATQRGMEQRPELVMSVRGPAQAPARVVDVSMLTGWLAMRSVEQQSKRIEAIEQGRPADSALPAMEPDDATDLPETAPILPRTRPRQPATRTRGEPPVQRVTPLSPPSAPSAPPARSSVGIGALPPPVEIRPAPGERRQVTPPQQAAPQQSAPPAETAPRAPSAQGNPFPTPIGSPPVRNF